MESRSITGCFARARMDARFGRCRFWTMCRALCFQPSDQSGRLAIPQAFNGMGSHRILRSISVSMAVRRGRTIATTGSRYRLFHFECILSCERKRGRAGERWHGYAAIAAVCDRATRAGSQIGTVADVRFYAYDIAYDKDDNVLWATDFEPRGQHEDYIFKLDPDDGTILDSVKIADLISTRQIAMDLPESSTIRRQKICSFSKSMDSIRTMEFLYL